MKSCPAKKGDYFEVSGTYFECQQPNSLNVANIYNLQFFAEIDLLCALSTCPGGDLSKAVSPNLSSFAFQLIIQHLALYQMWGEGVEGDDPSLECCRPLGVEVFSLPPDLLQGWSQPVEAFRAYKGGHALREAKWENA